MPEQDQGQELYHAERIITAQASAIDKLAATVEAQNTTIHVLSGTIERMLGTPGEEPVSWKEEDRGELHDRLREAVAQRRWNIPFASLDADSQHTVQQIVNAIIEELDGTPEEDTDGS